MVGAEAVVLLVLLLGLELLAPFAVPTLILPLVDEAVVVDLLNELPAALLVPVGAGLNEGVVADLQRVPDLAELAGHVIAVGLRVHTQFRGALRDLDGVLVIAHQEADVVPLHAAIASLHIGAELLERGADVRPAIGIVDGGRLEPLPGHALSLRRLMMYRR